MTSPSGAAQRRSDAGRSGEPDRQARALTRAAMAGVILLVASNIADVVTTRVALHLAAHHGRMIVEGNPLARLLLPAGRVEAIKLVVIGLLTWNTVRRPASLKVVCAVWATVGVYLMAILNNLLAISTLR